MPATQRIAFNERAVSCDRIMAGQTAKYFQCMRAAERLRVEYHSARVGRGGRERWGGGEIECGWLRMGTPRLAAPRSTPGTRGHSGFDRAPAISGNAGNGKKDTQGKVWSPRKERDREDGGSRLIKGSGGQAYASAPPPRRFEGELRVELGKPENETSRRRVESAWINRSIGEECAGNWRHGGVTASGYSER